MTREGPGPTDATGVRQAVGLVAVVVTHNRLAQLRVTLARLLAVSEAILMGVVVVDNASGDGTRDWLASQTDPRLKVIRCEQNTGGAGGFARGLQAALEQFAFAWAVVMDDDARPAVGALEAFAARGAGGGDALAAAVYYPDGRICEMNRPSLNPFWHREVFVRCLKGAARGHLRDAFHLPRESYLGDQRVGVDGASFVGLFLSRHVIERAGLPDGGLFLYGDDVIYTLGLRRLGLRMVFDPAVRFEHDCSTFAGDQLVVLRPLWKVYYRCRNGLMVYHAASGWVFWLLLPFLVLRWRLAARRYGDDRRTYVRLMWRSVLDGLGGRTDRGHAEVMNMAAGQVTGR